MRAHRIGRDQGVVVLLLIALGLFGLLGAPLAPLASAADVPHAATTGLLQDAARSLRWPERVSSRPDLPGQAAQVSVGDPAGTPMAAVITVLSIAEGPAFLDALQRPGMTRGTYHGWEAVIQRRGDQAASARGLIAWHAGPYGFIAEDATGSGRELEIAEALYAAAQGRQLSGWSGSTAIVLAQTEDAPGAASIGDFQALTQQVNDYYRLNSYGRVDFTFSWLDADGDAGSEDWHTVAPTLAAYAENRCQLAKDALRAAFARAAQATASLPPAVYLERAIVVYAAGQAGAARPFPPSMCSLGRAHAVDVQNGDRATRIHVPYVLLLSEQDPLGVWAHELGHTLHARHEAGADDRLADRYTDPKAPASSGTVGFWDLMALGSYWGAPAGSAPTQMSSYTKEAAGWLRYRQAQLGQEYTLTALESQSVGDEVLFVDGPSGGRDGGDYYVLEARDRTQPHGAPETGVMIYHVTRDPSSGHDIVEPVYCQNGEPMGYANGAALRHSTLHGTAEGLREATSYTLRNGVVIRLLAESFSPYRATVRIQWR